MIKWYLPQQWREPTTIYHYALAIVSVAVAIVAAELITRLLNAEAIASSMLCAVIFTAWFGGFGPALLAIALAVLSFHYYLVPPINSFTWKHDLFGVGISEVPRLILFSIVSILIAFLISAQRKITETLRRSRDELRTAIADQKRMEATLQSAFDEIKRSEDRLRLVIDTIPTLVWRAGSDGAPEFLNQRCLDYTGLSLDQALDSGWASAIHPDDSEGLLATWRAIRKWRTRGETEARLRRFDGKYRWFLFRIEPLHDEGGNIVEWYASGTDIEDRKQTENALRQSEAYLAEAQRLSHTSSWAWDVRLQEFVFRSAEVYHLFGLDPAKDAVSPQPLLDRILPEDRDRVSEMARRAVREKADLEVDFRVARPDGSTRYVHSVGHPVVGDGGEVVELVGTHVDVTEQHLAKVSLQEAFDEIKKSEDRLRLVIDTIPTLVWRASPEGIPDFLNQPALDYTGISSDQAETGWPRAFHPDDMKGMLVKWAAIRESGMPGGLEARLRRFDGEYRWFLFQAVPLRDEAGNIVKWYGSSTDIEDRKRAEEALRESEQRFRDYAETASDWLWETGPDHRFTRISEHVNAIGFQPSGVTGVTRWDVATDVESEPEKWRQHRAILDAHRPFRDFVYTVNGTGAAIYVQTSGKPIYDATGNFLGYRGTGTDISAAIRADHAEQALREAQAELAHVTRVTTLGELTASIAHEVNQPLAAVVSNAEACLRWLGRETPNLEAARRSAEWIISDGNRASGVMQRVRALAKKSTIERVPLNINDLVRETVALVQHELISHQVLLRTELASNLPMVEADRVQLQQVIINLVMNGIEAMQPVADRLRELVIRSLRDEAPQVLVSVADCGVGISAENADRLFNAFFTTKPSGMGMGLSICRSIVEAHGGRLWSTGNLPHGATFHFNLPVRADLASDPHAVELPAADASGS
jgi:PAS domain S-box-containing protein